MTSLIQPELPEEPFDPGVPAPPVEPAPPPAADESVPIESLPQSWQDEIRSLRQENADRRHRTKAYDDAFTDMDDDTRDAWLEYTSLVVRAQNGDPTALSRIEEMFGGDEEPQAPTSAPVPPEPPVDYAALARQAAEEVYAERDRARIQDEQIAAVRKAGEDLGYQYGTEDYILFVRGANEAAQSGSGDPIAAGDAAVKAYRQHIIDTYLGAKGEQAESSPQVPTGAGATPDLTTRPFNDQMSESQRWAAVRESAMARFGQSQ